MYGDKGSISQSLNDELALAGISLVTNTCNNMKPKDISLWDRVMLRKRYLIETIFGQLKNISYIEYTRYLNPLSLLLEVTAGLLAYTFQPKKPSLNLTPTEMNCLIQI
ncbi:hypothetical protein GPY23_20550 [Photorhabdus bodei]|uniref:Transposase DDE domain-containing protein n=1 Tax=Photorhabdus bodei TaxID=2029681 RepID=A0ABX0AUV3_9GAMM|nr:hypothetical protein [Photorhabdus bodei]NDL05512.1 hypothetical protein [Photorhabdus bodei]NDL08454.1 hypothetical protein [Photorhabdus bodei]